MRLSLYFDEDSMDQALIRALIARGVDVTSALTEGMIERPDREHLHHATSLGRVLYSFNVADFCRLHSELLNEGEHHAGFSRGLMVEDSMTRKDLQAFAARNWDLVARQKDTCS